MVKTSQTILIKSSCKKVESEGKQTREKITIIKAQEYLKEQKITIMTLSRKD